jgi:hypothetical protein
MSNELKNFIDQHRNEFDDYEPSSKVWDNLQNDLNKNNTTIQQKATAKKLVLYKWVAAASVILLMGLSILFFTRKNTESTVPDITKTTKPTPTNTVVPTVITKDTPIIKTAVTPTLEEKTIAKEIPKTTPPITTPKKNVVIEHNINTDMIAFNESKAHFTKLITSKQNEIKNLSKNDPEVYQNFMKDIDELNKNYKQLNQQLPRTTNKSALINAMIYNLQVQIDLLNKQLIILNKIESLHKKNKYEKDILST